MYLRSTPYRNDYSLSRSSNIIIDTEMKITSRYFLMRTLPNKGERIGTGASLNRMEEHKHRISTEHLM